MLFDITTIERARDSIIHYLKIDEKKLEEYLEIHSFDFEVSTFLKDFEINIDQLELDNIELVALHLTSSNNECDDFKKYGIQDLHHTLNSDNALSRFLKEQDITFNQNYKYFIYDGTIYNIENTDLYEELTNSCINCFLSVDDTGYFSKQLQIRPGIVTAISEITGDNSIKDFWDLNHDTYMIKFKDDLSAFNYESLSDNHNIQDAILEIICYAIDMILFNGHVEISVYMDANYIVKPEKIIYTRNYYNN